MEWERGWVFIDSVSNRTGQGVTPGTDGQECEGASIERLKEQHRCVTVAYFGHILRPFPVYNFVAVGFECHTGVAAVYPMPCCLLLSQVPANGGTIAELAEQGFANDCAGI